HLQYAHSDCFCRLHSPRRNHRSSIERKATRCSASKVFRRWNSPVSLLLEQTSGFTFSTQSTPIAPPAISISVLPSNRKMAQWRPRLQPTSPTSEGKTSATGAISIRFEASKLITSQPRNTSAAIHSSYSFSSQRIYQGSSSQHRRAFHVSAPGSMTTEMLLLWR